MKVRNENKNKWMKESNEWKNQMNERIKWMNERKKWKQKQMNEKTNEWKEEMNEKTNEWKKLVKVSQTYWEGGRVFVACKFQWIFWNVKNRVSIRVSVEKMSPNITFHFKQTP